jgi:trimeric autotransporter adhesin
MKFRIGCVVVGLLSLSLFVFAQTPSSTTPASASAPSLSGSGTKDFVPLWLSTTKLGNSTLYQKGKNVGIGTKAPAATLDVNGTVNAATSFNLAGQAFAFGSSANGNAFLGFAGNSSSTGTFNLASGFQALYANTTGSLNTASGSYSLTSNTTGSYNTGNGNGTLYFNTTGGYNTADGVAALYNNSTGSFNTAGGFEALYNDSTGGSNTAGGYEALYNNSTGGENTADGLEALFSNTTGGYNTADGEIALYSNTTGEANTASGYQALYNNTTGDENTAVGFGALDNNTTGDDLTCIGYGCTAARNGLHNATAIGAHAVVGESNALVLGGTGKYAVKIGIGTTTPSNILTIAQGAGHPVSDGWETFSSRRWKTNIQTLQGALGKVEQLRGVSYDLKANGKHEVGVIAEEVGAVVPEVVTWEGNGKDARSVDYTRLTALLIEATKEQQREIQAQQAALRTQAAAIRDLKCELRATRQTVQKVKAQIATAQPTLVAAR